MKWVPLFVSGCALVTAVSCVTSSAEAEPGASSNVVNFSQRQVSVPQLYNENCVNCHGNSGQGGGAGTKTLLTEEKFDQKWDKPFFDAIKNGVESMGMAPFGEAMTDEQIWSLVVHIREKQAAALRSKNGSPKPDSNGVYSSQHYKFKVEEVFSEGLKTPWAVDWLPTGEMLVTNRPGYLILVKNGVGTRIEGIPESREVGQGGLMDVGVHPDYAKNGWIYLALSSPLDTGRNVMTHIVRGKIKGNQWVDNQLLFSPPKDSYSGAGVHHGCRIVFDGKGHIYFSIGDRGQGDKAQDVSQPNGKVYRINEDGSIPSDNPFVNKAGAIKAVWSYGHRNPQGLAMDSKGVLWDTEHAPRGGDEVNLIQKGKNYGWPDISFAINYQNTPYKTPWPKAGQDFLMPAFRWLPSTGACGLDIGRGGNFPKWKDDLFAGGLSGANVDRLRMKDGKLIEREELLHGMGRVRDVVSGPNGNIYVVLNQPDKVIRIVPAN